MKAVQSLRAKRVPLSEMRVSFRARFRSQDSFVVGKKQCCVVSRVARVLRLYGVDVEFWRPRQFDRFLSQGPFVDEDGRALHDMRVTCDRAGRWYLCCPFAVVPEGMRPLSLGAVAAIDPGVRTIASVYSTSRALKLGSGVNMELKRASQRVAELQRRLASMEGVACHRARWHILRKIRRVWAKAVDRRNDAHRKIINHLVGAQQPSPFSLVLLPSLPVAELARCEQRRGPRLLSRASAFQMVSLGLDLFEKRLKDKAVVVGSAVSSVGEAYTTKTCGRCGGLTDVGGAKWYRCRHCAFEVDRDLNAARNIFLSSLWGAFVPRLSP
jgi:putative transposase